MSQLPSFGGAGGAETASPPTSTNVGAMRLRFSRLGSSGISDATLSRFTPATAIAPRLWPLLLLGPPGVCGGVNKGREPDGPEPAAVVEGTLLITGVGLFITGGAFWSGGCAKLDCVAALEADMLRAGEAGRAGCENGDGEGAGGGAIVLLLFDWFEGCLAIAGTAGTVVGVACGVEVAEFALATEIGVGVCRAMLGGG